MACMPHSKNFITGHTLCSRCASIVHLLTLGTFVQNADCIAPRVSAQVAEVFTGTPGKYVPLENTIKDFKGVLEVSGLRS